MSRRESGSVLAADDLGALLGAAGAEVVAAFQKLEPAVDGASLASLLSAWSAALIEPDRDVDAPPIDWLLHGRSVAELRLSHQRLRSAILGRLPAAAGLGVAASEHLGRLFDDSLAQSVARLGQRAPAPAAAAPAAPLFAEGAPRGRRVRQALEVEHANFANLARQTPEMVCVLSGPEHRFELVNEAHIRVLGFDATGRTVRDAQPESVEVHQILDDVYRTGKTAELHEIPVTVTNRLRYFNLTYAARRDAEGVIDGIMILGSEVTDEVLFRLGNRLQQRALELALEDAPLASVLEVLCQMVEQLCGSGLRASVLLLDDDGRRLPDGAAPSLPVGYQPCWSVPIKTAQGKLLGTFALSAQAARQPTARESQIVDIAVRTTALILGRRREIRERLGSAEALREREAELKFTLAAAKLGTWHLDFTRGGTVTMSEEAAAILNRPARELDASSLIAEAIYPQDRERVRDVLQRAIETDGLYRDEYRVCRANGEIRWVEARGRALYGKDGAIRMLSGVCLDITEQKRAEEALRASKRMLELAASCGRVGFWHVDSERGTFEIDENMATDWGLDLTRFARTVDAILAIVHPADRHLITSGMERALAGSAVYDQEFRIILPSGEERWIQSQGESHLDENGKRTLFSGVSIDITDKKLGQLAKQRIADAIAKEREKLEQVLEQSGVSIALFEGPQHVFSFANSAYLRTFDLTKSILGKPIAEAFPAALVKDCVNKLDEVYATGASFEGHEHPFSFRTRAGVVRSQYFDFIYAAKRDSAHRIDGVLATIIDVTDRVALRQATDKANALLSAERYTLDQIIQNSPAAMATWVGPNLVFERVNSEYAKIFPGRELVGRELLEACPELRGQGFDAILRRVLETGEPYTGSEALARIAQTPGGPLEDRYFDFKYLRINDGDGNPYCVYDFALDVTDRVLAQRRIDEANARLRETEDLLSRAIEVANIGFFHWDMANDLIVFSPQMQKDWGIEANTKIEDVMLYIHPDDRERVSRAVAKTAVAGGKYLEEYRVRRPTDGKVIWIEAQGGLAPDRQGRLTWFIGTSLDITRRKNTEEQLRAASVDAHNASTAKSAFLANMSHEIRTPLGAIMGFAELLKKPELTPAHRESFVSVIERNSQHLLRIVDDILDLSKVEAGKLVFENIEFSLLDLLSDFASLMDLRARDKGINFALLITTAIPMLVSSDPTRLRQILNNVVGNAIKFTERGLVELRVRYEDGLLEFEVRDTGRGISLQQAERLFQPFVQADESISRKFGGTGLGLVLTRRLAAAMGGDFYLKESVPSMGSVFVAHIRVAVSRGTPFTADQRLGVVPAGKAAAAPERMLAGMRILVIDDSPDNRTLLSVVLEDAGASVESASDGQQGVALALEKPFDAVLLDIQMPRMDGYQAIELLNSRGYRAPIIALTAHAMVEERERAHDKGFAAFMTKPIQRESLLHLLDKLRSKPRASTAAAAPARPTPTVAPKPASGILLVEDSEDSSMVLELFLSSRGHQVRCARTGQQALALIGEGYAPSLVLLDLTLPDMSGQEVLEAVRRAPACQGTRIVLVSGWDDLAQRAQQLGADGSLRKPINLSDVDALARAAGSAGT